MEKLPIVRIRDGNLPRPWGQQGIAWRQCEVIADDSSITIDMVPALICGWNYGRITRFGHESWCGMSAAAIVTFKAGDTCARLATDEERASILAWLSAQGHLRAA